MSDLNGKAEKIEEWTVTNYTLLQILPGAGHQAVFVDDNDDGTASLRAEFVDFMGLARRTEVTYRGIRGKTYQEVRRRGRGNEIVSVTLYDSGFDIDQEMENFSGNARLGDPLWRATSHLAHRYRARLRPEFREPEEGGAADSSTDTQEAESWPRKLRPSSRRPRRPRPSSRATPRRRSS